MTHTKPLTRADRFEALGREAALAGVGIGDRHSLLAALTEACGPFALGDRSAWLIGHEIAVTAMLRMAQEAAAISLTRKLRAAGLTVEPWEFASVYVSDDARRWKIHVGDVEDVTP